jgi:2-phospho-L-lactate guanylyltransferase
MVVVPVKRLAGAKSRLRGALPAVPHEDLVLALVLDTLDAALACPAVAGVRVVTDEPRIAVPAARAGAGVVPDTPDAGLNAALAHAAGQLPGRAVAGLAGDLPALRPAELAGALSAATARGFVADASGTGTTLLAAPPGVPLDPRFGPGSAAAHAASGARPLVGAWPSLRQDVDTPSDLWAAARLGLGPRTAALENHYRVRMQGTVATFDAQRRNGTVLLDDGTEVSFDTAAFDASGLRLLRSGQRLRLTQRDGHVVDLALITM